MTQAPMHPHNYNLRTGLILYPTQQDAIESLLDEMFQQIPAHFILLIDVTGQVISTRGGQNQMDLVGLGSLVAGDLAASQEIARLTGQYQEYQMVLREGQSTHTFICGAGLHLAITVQISTETPLGWARMLIRKAALKLTDIAANPPVTKTRPLNSALILESDENLSDLFDDALDDLWLKS
jgi:predicted regulator of Ras-like GTPase activity (Roadblock/LC7/MglB family)